MLRKTNNQSLVPQIKAAIILENPINVKLRQKILGRKEPDLRKNSMKTTIEANESLMYISSMQIKEA